MATRTAFAVDIQSNIDQISKNVPRKLQGLIPVASARALNKTMAIIKTSTARKTARRLGVPVKTVKGTMTVQRAFKEHLRSKLRIRSKRPFNVISYGNQKATQTATGVKHNAWSPGRSKTLAEGAFVMPHGGKKRTKPGRKTGPRPGARRGKPPKRKIQTVTRATHFVAKRKGGKIIGLFGGWPTREFTGRKGGSKTPGLHVNATKEAIALFPQQYFKELSTARDVALGRLQLRGVQPRLVARRFNVRGSPGVRETRAVLRRPLGGPVGVLPG